MPGHQRAAEVLALARDDVEGGRGAEVHAHRLAAEALPDRDRVDEPVGADLARVVVADRHAGARARADHEHLVAEVAARHRGPLGLQLGHRGGDDRGVQLGEAQPRSSSRLRSAAPSSSAVDWRTVAKRQCSTSRSPSKAPKWVWVLPTSTASSIGAHYARRPMPASDAQAVRAPRLASLRGRGSRAGAASISTTGGSSCCRSRSCSWARCCYGGMTVPGMRIGRRAARRARARSCAGSTSSRPSRRCCRPPGDPRLRPRARGRAVGRRGLPGRSPPADRRRLPARPGAMESYADPDSLPLPVSLLRPSSR